MSLPEPPLFCPRCGAALEAPGATCRHDGSRWFPDPKVAVGVLVSDDAVPPRLLLVRRNHEPALGAWAFPSGFVDAGEVIEEAAAREVREEANIEVEVGALLGAWSDAGNPVVFLAYRGRLRSGTPTPGPEASGVAWFASDALPPLAFDHDGEVVAAWRRHVTDEGPARDGAA